MEDARQKLICDLVGQAGRGIPQLDWLHQSILDAGYVRKEDRMTKQEVREMIRQVTGALDALACECAQKCGENMLDKFILAIQQTKALEGAR